MSTRLLENLKRLFIAAGSFMAGYGFAEGHRSVWWGLGAAFIMLITGAFVIVKDVDELRHR